MEPFGQDVHQEAADELIGGERHALVSRAAVGAADECNRAVNEVCKRADQGCACSPSKRLHISVNWNGRTGSGFGEKAPVRTGALTGRSTPLTGLLVNLTRAIPEGAFLGAADSYLRRGAE